jgi:uncharacterized protein YecA (UPF0149 family)
MLAEGQKQIVYGFFHWVAGWQAAREAFARSQEPTLAERVGLEGKHAPATSDAPADASAPASANTPAPSKTPGRNDPCFCGSGKKFKKCHGA